MLGKSNNEKMKKEIQLLALSCLLLIAPAGAYAQQLISATVLGNYTKEQVSAFLPIPGLARYDVRVYKIRYTTPDIRGVRDTASGLLAQPLAANSSWPVMVYQHGTAGSRVAVPSRMSSEASIGLIGAALGYVSVLPDYLGLGDSRGFHPYVHAASEASAAVDMVRAVRQLAANGPFSLNGQIFITGYSQGGHAGMALHREMEQKLSGEFKVAAAAHLSGPYSISGDMKARLLSDAEYFFPAYTLYTMLSYNMVYKIYDNLEQFINPPYLETAKAFYSGSETVLDSIHNRLARTLIQQKGKVVPRFIFQDSVVQALQNNPNHPVNLAMLDNDTYRWAPKAPTRLYYCKGDDQVIYTNSVVADSVMRALGAPDVAATDLNPSFNHGQCVQPALFSTIIFFSFYQSIQTDLAGTVPARPLRMYPNPASESVYLEQLPADAQVEIWDMAGRPVRNYGPVQEALPQISLVGLPPGIYVLRARSTEGVWAGKLAVR
ncbi:MAG: hypothetical protein RL386_653 [Bacteroidota bacterium]